MNKDNYRALVLKIKALEQLPALSTELIIYNKLLEFLKPTYDYKMKIKDGILTYNIYSKTKKIGIIKFALDDDNFRKITFLYFLNNHDFNYANIIKQHDFTFITEYYGKLPKKIIYASEYYFYKSQLLLNAYKKDDNYLYRSIRKKEEFLTEIKTNHGYVYTENNEILTNDNNKEYFNHKYNELKLKLGG